jgi:hypothetical protein
MYACFLALRHMYACFLAADKLRTELATTTTDLSTKLRSAVAARAAAEAEAESSRLGLGSMSQQMAKTAAELDKERSTAQELKARVMAQNKHGEGRVCCWQRAGCSGVSRAVSAC